MAGVSKRTDPYSPHFELVINGAVMTDDFHLLVRSASFEDEGAKISAIKFNISPFDNAKAGVVENLMDSKILSPGNLVVIRGGYGNDITDIGAGYITDLEPDFPDSESPTLNITCYDKLQQLSRQKSLKGQTFTNYRDSQIISIIGERNGFYIREVNSSTFYGIRKTTGIKTRIQKIGTTDLKFMQEIAKDNGFDLFCRWDKSKKRFALFFEPFKDRTKKLFTFVYGDGDIDFGVREQNGEYISVLRSFSKPRLSLTSQFTNYRVVSWNEKNTAKVTYEITLDQYIAGQEPVKLGGIRADKRLSKKVADSTAGLTNKAFGNATEIITTKLFPNATEAKTFLLAHMQKISQDFITGPAVVDGNQFLQSRQIHTFDGLGSFFNGRYYLKKVMHKFTATKYMCNLDVRKVVKESE